MKEITFSIIYKIKYTPEQLGLSKYAPRTELMDYADCALEATLAEAYNAIKLMPDEITTEIIERNEEI